nr:hypothetical protein [Algoriphagus locisalis]
MKKPTEISQFPKNRDWQFLLRNDPTLSHFDDQKDSLSAAEEEISTQ